MMVVVEDDRAREGRPHQRVEVVIVADRQWNRGAQYRSAPKPSTPAGGDGPNPNQVLAQIPRGDSEELRISVQEYNGRPFVQMQVWAADDAGELVPVRWKSSTVRVRELGQVIAALRKAESQLGGSNAPDLTRKSASGAKPGPRSKGKAPVPTGDLFGDDEAGVPSAKPGAGWVQPEADDEMPF